MDRYSKKLLGSLIEGCECIIKEAKKGNFSTYWKNSYVFIFCNPEITRTLKLHKKHGKD